MKIAFMLCSVHACRNEGAHRVVVMIGGVLGGHRVRVRVQLPLVACSAHSHAGAFWAPVLRIIPRTFSALLANCGISVPHLHHTRVRFVPLAPARARSSRVQPQALGVLGTGGWD